MTRCHVLAAWQRGSLQGHRAAVSLHSHTSHSREALDFIPRFAAACPPVAGLLRRYEARYQRLHGYALDYGAAWWTPPLGPREALAVERRQVEELGLRPLVSITDHDNIEAPLLLRVLPGSFLAPIGMEWTVPWRGTTFHLGLHGLPAAGAAALVAELNDFTAQPEERRLQDLLARLAESPTTLVVFNHPYWDEKGAGRNLHARRAEEFLALHGRWLHALELNGLRPWTENQRTMELAAAADIPYLSGGDRHACEPNALLNLTSAESFEEFVSEVREQRRSTVAVMPQYREPMLGRILAAIADVMRENRAHTHGWTGWSDRVFFRRRCGRVEALSAVFPRGGEPSLVRGFVACSRLLDNRHLLAAMRGFSPPATGLEP